MSIVFNANLPPSQPQTHALIIDVGEYLHLPGGPKHAVSPAVPDFGLNQLTSTVVSVAYFADWLQTKLRNPTAPLGSINLLLSPKEYTPNDSAAERLGQPAGTIVPVDLATSDLIRAAFGNWFLKLNNHSDNIGLFLFADHGLEAAHRYLVPADFLESARLLAYFQDEAATMNGCVGWKIGIGGHLAYATPPTPPGIRSRTRRFYGVKLGHRHGVEARQPPKDRLCLSEAGLEPAHPQG
jgi:hypothetical protein